MLACACSMNVRINPRAAKAALVGYDRNENDVYDGPVEVV